MVVVDECHLVTEWERTKPLYKNLGDVRNNYRSWPFVLMSATVTPKDQAAILTKLKLESREAPVVLRGVCNRPSIYYIAIEIFSKNLNDADKLESTDTVILIDIVILYGLYHGTCSKA